MEFIEIHWTAGTLDELRRVCRYLVQERLVACVQIIPWVESIYMWNNQLETAQESLAILKTRKDLYDQIRTIIEENCSYEIPQILFYPIKGGNASYLKWMEEEVSLAIKKEI